MSITLTPSVRASYAFSWANMKVTPSRVASLKALATKFAKNRAQYAEVETLTGVPWWWIAIVHERESSCDFSTYLGNGDPLDRVSTHEPAGRGPFPTWSAGAVDAIRLQGLDKWKDWSIEAALFQFEAYNGWGYLGKTNSPYVWSWSNLYSRGKYVADGVFSPTTIDPQPGCASMLFQMILAGLIPQLVSKVIGMSTDTPVPTAPTVPSAGVTVNPIANLATHALVFLGGITSMLGLTQAHSVVDALSNSQLFTGLVVSGLGFLISHFNVAGSNSNTITLADDVLVMLTRLVQGDAVAKAATAEPTPTAA